MARLSSNNIVTARVILISYPAGQIFFRDIDIEVHAEISEDQDHKVIRDIANWIFINHLPIYNIHLSI